MNTLNAYLYEVDVLNSNKQFYTRYLWVFAYSPRDAKQIINLRMRQHLEEKRYTGPLDWFNGCCFTKPHQRGDIIQGYTYGR